MGISTARFASGYFLKTLDRLTQGQSEIHLVVIDDMALLEGLSHWKGLHQASKKIRLDFSYHGHDLALPPTWGGAVDRMFFLTNSGYRDTLLRNDIFTPQVHIIGNGTDSQIFFPLSREEKLSRKLQLGYTEESKIVLWVSNPRPQKGLKLFLELGKKLIDRYPDLQILIIGNSQEMDLPSQSWRSLGRIPNSELPFYLQIGDFYCFTSLWREGFGLSLIEAAKCGNQVIASCRGGIPEVVSGLEGAYLVENPNSIEDWQNTFDKAYREKESFLPNPDVLAGFHELRDWETRFMTALIS